MLNSLELRIARQRRGLMQKDLASVLGLTPVTYSQKERGRRHMSVDEAQKVAETLRLKDDEILGIFFGGGVNAKYKDENTGVHDHTKQIHLDGDSPCNADGEAYEQKENQVENSQYP